MKVFCPGCGIKLELDRADYDARMECPKCGRTFRPSNVDQTKNTRKSTPKLEIARKPAPKPLPIVPVLAFGAAIIVLLVVAIVTVAIYKKNNEPKPFIVIEAKNPGFRPPPTVPLNSDPLAPVAPKPGPPPEAKAPAPMPPEVKPPANNPMGTGTKPDDSKPPETKPPETNVRPATPLELLFAKTVAETPPPKMPAMLMEKTKETLPLTVPTFFSIRKSNEKPNAQPPKYTKLTLEEVKAATVYIKVDAGDMSSTGSGFYIGAEGNSALVATNHHVIDAALTSKRFGNEKGIEKTPTISCVFNSGVPGFEWESLAKVTAFDPIADLAVLRLETPRRMPKPIDPWGMPKLTETMEVRICGFPFGGQLATSTDNPNINVGTGSISSLRLNKAGALEQVQVSGALNPGNSGGPIVDKDGRLTGVAVATITGSGLGFAVPVNDLIGLLEGKILLTEFLPLGINDGKAKFKVIIPIMDPRSRVRAVYLRYWTGTGLKPVLVRDARTGYLPMPGADDQLNMIVPNTSSALTVLSGDLKLPFGASEVIVQMGSEDTAGNVAVSPPVLYKLEKKDVETGSDTRAFNDVFSVFNAKPDTQVVVRARILGLENSRSAHQVLAVSDISLKTPNDFRFYIDRATAGLLDEVDPEDQSKEVRLSCLIGQKDERGIFQVRVTRVDFLDESNTVCHSTANVDKKNVLSELNRDPSAYAGKKITFEALAVPMTKQTAGSDNFRVLFESLRKPRNLDFVLAKGLNDKIVAEKIKPNGVYKTRLTVTVGEKMIIADQSMKVTVSKIELLDPKDGTVIKTIE